MKKYIVSIVILMLITVSAFAQSSSEKPYVLIVSFDGFRWDYPDRGITPNMDKMAEEGVRALSFQPEFPSKTFPNHYSIVTGLHPQNHGLISNHITNPVTGDSYRIGDSSAVRNDMWYQGETIWASATRAGIKSASFFWPGSETHLAYKHPTYFMEYEHHMPHEKRIQGILDWLQLPEEQRPHLLFLYFSDTDTQGHRHGPDSQELNDAVKLLDKRLGELRDGLKKIGMLDKINLILLSDHGMTRVCEDKQIFLEDVKELQDVKIDGSSNLVHIYTKDQQQKLNLKKSLTAFHTGYDVYLKDEVPTYYHYNKHPFIGDILLIAKPGFTFSKRQNSKKKYHSSNGDHGFNNYFIDMHGIFYASGPAFKSGFRTGTIKNIDFYPLVCEILGIDGNQKIDGKLERIAPILK